MRELNYSAGKLAGHQGFSTRRGGWGGARKPTGCLLPQKDAQVLEGFLENRTSESTGFQDWKFWVLPWMFTLLRQTFQQKCWEPLHILHWPYALPNTTMAFLSNRFAKRYASLAWPSHEGNMAWTYPGMHGRVGMQKDPCHRTKSDLAADLLLHFWQVFSIQQQVSVVLSQRLESIY